MKLYTINDLNKGAGVFDHIMRTESGLPSRHKEMPGAVGIGVIAAAITAGLNERELKNLLRQSFDTATGGFLEKVLSAYLGADNRLHLWNRTGSNNLQLNGYNLHHYSTPDWSLNRSADYNCHF